MERPDIDRVRDILALDHETGILTWRKRISIRVQIGERAGSLHGASGYRIVSFDGTKYREHVLVWYMIHGEWLPRQIDHINRVRSDNRPDNLRVASESQQRQNTKLRSDNKTGARGVSWHALARKYTASVWRFGERKYLGLFETKKEAADVARAERLKMFGQYAPSYDHGA